MRPVLKAFYASLILLFAVINCKANSVTDHLNVSSASYDNQTETTASPEQFSRPPIVSSNASESEFNVSQTETPVAKPKARANDALSRLSAFFNIGSNCQNISLDSGATSESAEQTRTEMDALAPKMCPAVADFLLCFPATPANQTFTIRCPFKEHISVKSRNANVFKYCLPNGTWAATDYMECSKSLVAAVFNTDCRTKNQTGKSIECDDVENPNESIYKYMASLNAIGFCISILFVSTALFIFISIRSLRCLRNMIHCNLLFSFLLKAVTFNGFYIFVLNEGVDLWKINHVLCIIFNVFWNYTLLAGFFWMMIEAVYLITVIVAAYSSNKIKLWWYLIIGWVVPMIPIIPYTTLTSVASNTTCSWIQPEYQSTNEIFIDGPIYIVLAINLILLIIILYVIVTKLKNHNDAERNKYSQYKKLIKATLLLFPLFGLTFAVFFWHPPQAETTFAKVYFFVNIFLQTSQGVWVSLFYCFLNDEVKNALQTKFRSWKVSHVGTNIYQLGNGGGSTRHHHASPTSCTTQITSNYITRYRTDSAPVEPGRLPERLPMLPEDHV